MSVNAVIDEVVMLGHFAAACELAAHGNCDAHDFADLMQRADGYRRLQEIALGDAAARHFRPAITEACDGTI